MGALAAGGHTLRVRYEALVAQPSDEVRRICAFLDVPFDPAALDAPTLPGRLATFAPLFAGLPLHGAPAGFERPRALVSVLGFSWQPVALMAAWARPERMLAIGKSLGVIDDALFSAVVLMVILTTLLAPPFLKRSLQNETESR